MKKLLLIISLVLSMVSVFGADRSKTLKIYNWADYISPEVLETFPKWYYQQTGEEVEIIYNTFDVNENMLTQIEVGKEDYDVICPSEYIIERMIKINLLQKIPYTLLPDSINYIKYVSPFVLDKFNQLSDTVRVYDYSVGYMWGTTGWLYNVDKVAEKDVYSLDVIKNQKYKDNIYMKDAFRDIYSVVVLYAYQEDIKKGLVTPDELVQHLTQERVDSVQSILLSVKDNIKGWEVDFGKEEMVKGNCLLNLSWSGDAQWAIEEARVAGVNLSYTIPYEGSNVWFDGWCIPIYAQNVKAATYFIDYLCRPDNAIKNMEEIGYVSVIASPEILEWCQDSIYPICDASYFFGTQYTQVHLNPVMYPDKSVIKKCALMRDAGDMNEALVTMWNKVKGDNLSIGYVIMLIVIIIPLIGFFVYRNVTKRKINEKQKRKKK